MKNLFTILKVIILIIIVIPFSNLNAQNIGINIGDKAPEIKLLDIDRKWNSLSDLHGKLVLISFNRVKGCSQQFIDKQNEAFEKFKDANFKKKGDGFGIYGVWMDNYEESWDRLLSQHKIFGIQVFDKGLQTMLNYKHYGVTHHLARNFLIDKDGIIIAKDIDNENLIEILKELEK